MQKLLDAMDPGTNVRILITSYDMVKKLDQRVLGGFRSVICDESHALKTVTTQRTRCLEGVVKRARRAMLMTGTPALSRPIELFPQARARPAALLALFLLVFCCFLSCLFPFSSAFCRAPLLGLQCARLPFASHAAEAPAQRLAEAAPARSGSRPRPHTVAGAPQASGTPMIAGYACLMACFAAHLQRVPGLAPVNKEVWAPCADQHAAARAVWVLR
jgi:hypothetical protein